MKNAVSFFARAADFLRSQSVRNLSDPRWIILKGFLFLFLGVLSAFLIIAERPLLSVAMLLLVAIWSFCRFYYFAFYVMGRYVDPRYRFTGLRSFVRYWCKNDKAPLSANNAEGGAQR